MEGMSSSQPEEVDSWIPRRGDEVTVLDDEWIEVENSCRNGNVSREPGGNFLIKKGGTIRVLKIDQETNMARVTYTTPGNETVYGTRCPTGAIFSIPLSRFGRQREIVTMILIPRERGYSSAYVEKPAQQIITFRYLMRLLVVWFRQMLSQPSSSSSNR